MSNQLWAGIESLAKLLRILVKEQSKYKYSHLDYVEMCLGTSVLSVFKCPDLKWLLEVMWLVQPAEIQTSIVRIEFILCQVRCVKGSDIKEEDNLGCMHLNYKKLHSQRLGKIEGLAYMLTLQSGAYR